MKKIIICIFCLMALLFDSCYQQMHKGPARWDDVYNLEQAKDRGVFAGLYNCEPFEYEDSTFRLKLVFANVYAVYWHWYDEKESIWKHTDERYIVAEIDTTLSFGLDKMNVSNNKHWSNVRQYFSPSVSCFSIGTKSNIFDLRPNDDLADSLCVPIEATPKYKLVSHRPEQKNIVFGYLIFKKTEL